MQNHPVLLDIHTHCISSGHGSRDTITDMARTAGIRSLKILGISDHGPATKDAGSSSYFRNLLLADRCRFGITLLYGVELNILNEKGDVDLEDSIISSLDYAFVSMHRPVFKADQALNKKVCTNAYINAMKHPGVRFLGHPDDGYFPVDYEQLLSACLKYQVYPEINNASLKPDAYRTEGFKNSLEILSLCKKLELPVLLSSDSHGKEHVGDMKYIFPLLKQCHFPSELIINENIEFFMKILGHAKTSMPSFTSRSHMK